MSDKRNRVQRCFDFLNAYAFTLKHRSKNAEANADVLSCLPLPATAEDLQPRYRLTDPSDLDVDLVGTSGTHPSQLRTSSDSSLGGLAIASGGLANALGGLATTPDDVFSWGGGGGSARAQKDGKQVSRAVSKKFLTEDETRHEQWKAIQAVHPRSIWAFQDEERSTEVLVDDYLPLVQPTIHAVVEGQLELGRLLSACPLTQEGIDHLQQTQGVVSAVTRSATRERARPLRNSTKTARDTGRGTAETTIPPANGPGTKEKYEIASNSRTTEMCDENDDKGWTVQPQ